MSVAFPPFAYRCSNRPIDAAYPAVDLTKLPSWIQIQDAPGRRIGRTVRAAGSWPHVDDPQDGPAGPDARHRRYSAGNHAGRRCDASGPRTRHWQRQSFRRRARPAFPARQPRASEHPRHARRGVLLKVLPRGPAESSRSTSDPSAISYCRVPWALVNPFAASGCSPAGVVDLPRRGRRYVGLVAPGSSQATRPIMVQEWHASPGAGV
jgi:hypothetical protein